MKYVEKLSNLVWKYETLMQNVEQLKSEICRFEDGFHYRMVFKDSWREWEQTYSNAYMATIVARDSDYCACTLFTNNPDILNNSNEYLGCVDAKFEEG